jgi:hypothetical protein
MKMMMLTNMDLYVIIGESATSDYVDLCEGLQVGEILFARHPYKFLTTFQSSKSSGNYWLTLEYSKTVDFTKTSNRSRCKRVRNSIDYNIPADNNLGSTVGGTYGYGKAKNSANDGKEAYTSSNSGGDSSNTIEPPEKVDKYTPKSVTLVLG